MKSNMIIDRTIFHLSGLIVTRYDITMSGELYTVCFYMLSTPLNGYEQYRYGVKIFKSRSSDFKIGDYNGYIQNINELFDGIDIFALYEQQARHGYPDDDLCGLLLNVFNKTDVDEDFIKYKSHKRLQKSIN